MAYSSNFARNLDLIARRYERKFGTKQIEVARKAHANGRHTNHRTYFAALCHICKAREVTPATP